MSYVHAFPHIRSFFSIYLDIFELFWDFSNCLLSLSPLSVHVSLLLWHPNVNLLRLGTLFVSMHPLLSTLLLSLSSFVMRRPNWTSLRTFLDEAFILNAKSSCRTSLTPTYPLSSTIGNGGHYMTPRSLVHLWWSWSFTLTCMDSIFQYLISLLVFKVLA